jgi:hypothetical protein
MRHAGNSVDETYQTGAGRGSQTLSHQQRVKLMMTSLLLLSLPLRSVMPSEPRSATSTYHQHHCHQPALLHGQPISLNHL